MILLEDLYLDMDLINNDQIRFALSKSRNPKLLEKLSKDISDYIRESVASNPKVRMAVSYNPNTPNEVLKDLLNDPFCKNFALVNLTNKKGLKLFI